MTRFAILGVMVCSAVLGEISTAQEESLLGSDFTLRNTVPRLRRLGDSKDLPIKVAPFEQHVNGGLLPLPGGQAALAVRVDGLRLFALAHGALFTRAEDGSWNEIPIPADASTSPAFNRLGAAVQLKLLVASNRENAGGAIPNIATRGLEEGAQITAIARIDQKQWLGTNLGIYSRQGAGDAKRHRSYGVDGPLASRITALAADAQKRLWVGTPRGISVLESNGVWRPIQGTEGLPYEDVTALVVDLNDNFWIGTTRGVIHYQPDNEVRQWYYRAGKRYVADDHINDIALSEDGRTVYAATAAGVSIIKVITTTLREKANTIEARVNKVHRRRGLVAACRFETLDDTSKYSVGDNDNDGLWTAYHIAAMSLAYATTKDPAHRDSARKGMRALYMLQNASGTPGLVARSVLPLDLGAKRNRDGNTDQWQLTPDKSMYWKSDTSSDEYCGHYLAFYTYWEHIAQQDPEERKLLLKQIRDVTDYLLANNYQLIDWTGKVTRWGFWNPERLNDNPGDYVENGLNSLQILSFLRVAHYVTGDPKYQEHYVHLIKNHGYLDNVLLEKKVFPDSVNHSDDQLGFCAWYPILQVEHDPVIRRVLHQAVRRHWRVEEPERSSYFTFIYASIDPNHADIEGAIQNLIEIPEDRRTWRMENSHRDDVVFDARPNRFRRPVLTRVLPADERNFEKWNADPFEPDGGGDGLSEDPGSAYLLPYWMGKFHGFLDD